MKERLKKTLSAPPLKIAVSIILNARVRYFIDAPVLRSLELKVLDRMIVSPGAIRARGETL